MIAALPLPVFLLIVAFFVGMAGVAVFVGLRARRHAAVVKDTPTTPIGMATDGYREFEGTIEAIAGPPVVAPLTRWPCVWYHARVEKYEHRRSGESGQGSWVLVREWTSAAPFLVRDATGACIVSPLLAEVTPTDKSWWHGDSEAPRDRNPKKVGPAESAKGMLDVPGSLKYRYSEERIYAGDPLLVLGEFSSNRFDRTAPDDEDDEGLHAEAGDDVHEGEGDSAEALRRDDVLFDEARKVTRAVIARGSGARPFILTTTSQAQHIALTEAGSKAAIGIAAVPLAIAAFLIWARFG